MKTAEQSSQNAWLIIRFAGLALSIYALWGLANALISAYEVHDQLVYNQERATGIVQFFPQSSDDKVRYSVLWKPLMKAAAVYLSLLLFGLYCLRKGAFLHSVLTYVPEMKLAEKPAQQVEEIQPEESEPVPVLPAKQSRIDQQKALYKQFLSEHPECCGLPAKQLHDAFRAWQT